MSRALLSLLLLTLTVCAHAANLEPPINTTCPPGMHCTPITTVSDNLNHDVDALKLEVGVVKQRLDDFLSKEANQVGLLANQTSYLGLLIAMISVLIAVLAIGAGFFVRRSTEKLAEKFEKDSQEVLRKAEGELEEISKAKNDALKEFEAHEEKLKRLQAYMEQRTTDLQTSLQPLLQDYASRIQQPNGDAENTSQYDKNKTASETEQKGLALLDSISRKPVEKMTASDYYVQALAAYSREDYSAAIEAAEQGLSPALSGVLDEEQMANLLFIKARCHSSQHELDQAIKAYQEIVSRLGNPPAPKLRRQIARAMLNLGVTYRQNGQSDEAIETYLQIIQRYEEDSSPAMREQVAKAMMNLGIAYIKNEQSDKAIETYQQIIQRYGEDSSPALREPVSKAMVNLGVSYRQKGQSDKAIETYLQIILRYREDNTLREQVAKAILNLGVTYGENGQLDKAIESYQQVIQRYGEDSSSALREQVAKAMMNLGNTYGQNGQPDKAFETYQQIIQRYGEDSSPTLELVASAHNNLGFSWLMQAKTMPMTEKAAQLQQALASFMQALVSCAEIDKAMVLGNLGYTHFLLGQPDEAERYTREGLQLGGEELYLGHLEDAKQNRLEPDDSDYEALLRRLWQELDTGEA